MRRLRSRLLRCLLDSVLTLLKFGLQFIFRMISIHQYCKADTPFDFLCLQNKFVFAAVILESFQASSIPCPLLSLHPGLSWSATWEKKLTYQMIVIYRVVSFAAIWSSLFLSREHSTRCPVISWTPTIQAFFFLRDSRWMQ